MLRTFAASALLLATLAYTEQVLAHLADNSARNPRAAGGCHRGGDEWGGAPSPLRAPGVGYLESFQSVGAGPRLEKGTVS